MALKVWLRSGMISAIQRCNAKCCEFGSRDRRISLLRYSNEVDVVHHSLRRLHRTDKDVNSR